ncbi:MAG: hypothetical protein AAFP86_02835 [Planctomycetota bacterium]
MLDPTGSSRPKLSTPARSSSAARPAFPIAPARTVWASLCLLLGACSGGSVRGEPDAVPVPDPAALQLLGPGAHLYVQEAYEGFPVGVQTAVAGRYDELVAAGMDTSRVLVDWPDLEPTPGGYDFADLLDQMDARAARGILHQFVNLTIVDSAGPSAPASIEAHLAAGGAWGDPEVVDPLLALLDALVPELVLRGCFMVGLANEPGGYYEDDPGSAAGFDALVGAAVDRIHEIEPRMACTVVFAGPADAGIAALMPLCDVASFNMYAYELELDAGCTLAGSPLLLWRSIATQSAVAALLDSLEVPAGGRLITIQEFGQAAGWDDLPETLGPLAGLSAQAAVFTALGAELELRSDRFRAACIWTLNDHTRGGIGYVGDELTAQGLPECFADNIEEIFGPTGLVRSDASASVRPAFVEVRAAIATLTQ